MWALNVCSYISDEVGELRIHSQLEPLQREQKENKYELQEFYFETTQHFTL